MIVYSELVLLVVMVVLLMACVGFLYRMTEILDQLRERALTGGLRVDTSPQANEKMQGKPKGFV
jgi:hypothetical protein